MARSQSTSRRRSSSHRPRQSPYSRSLAYRGLPLSPDPSPPSLRKPDSPDEGEQLRHELRIASSRRTHVCYVDDPPSPGSTISLESYGNPSRTISPSLTNSSLALDYQRSLSPLVATPTSSEDSSGFVFLQQGGSDFFHHQIAPQSQHHSLWNGQGHNQAIYSPDDRTAASLAGIGHNSNADTERFVGQRIEFISQHGPSPEQIQQYPKFAGPWTGVPLRQDDPMIIDTDPSPGRLESPLSPSSSNNERGSRRNGPLSLEQRQNANRVRQVGACLRCSCMKEKCDGELPCRNCRDKKGRKWKLGCVRERLDSRVDALFPRPIAQRYDYNYVHQYIHQSGFYYLNRDHFTLKIEMGLHGDPLMVPVKEIEPVDHKRELRSFQLSEDAHGECLKASTIWDPPIVLYLLDKERAHHSMMWQLKTWMSSVFEARHPETGERMWPWPCFDFDRMDWVGEIAAVIHEFQQTTDLAFFQSINRAQSLLFFNYILDHPFLVRGEERERLFSKLENKPLPEQVEGKEVSPETIQRFIKSLIYPFVKSLASEILKELHDHLLTIAKSKEPSPAMNDVAFCLSFVMLIFIGQTQARLVLLNSMATDEKGIELDDLSTTEFIQDMEDKVANFIINFHEVAVKKRRKPSSLSPTSAAGGGITNKPYEEHSARFGLMAKVVELTQKYRAYTFLPLPQPQASAPPAAHRSRNTMKTMTELFASADELKPESLLLPNALAHEEFEKENMHRLCWKFVDAVLSRPDQ